MYTHQWKCNLTVYWIPALKILLNALLFYYFFIFLYFKAVKVGVQMDLERQRKKKENLQLFEDQKKLTEALIKAGKEDMERKSW